MAPDQPDRAVPSRMPVRSETANSETANSETANNKGADGEAAASGTGGAVVAPPSVPTSQPASPDPAAVEAAMRRWVERAVIGLNLCPFAKAVWVKGQVRIAVSRARHLDGFLDDLDAELLRLRDTPAAVLDTTLLVHPTLFPDFFVFNDFLDVVDRVVAEHGLEGVIQVAPFHPDFVFEGSAADDIANATNRAPYPTLHLLREDSVARAVASGESAETIVERNIATLRALGPQGWRHLLQDDRG
ncbi:hypothetical protein Ttaiw_01706 [Tepidimonas taiwanensis]|uniref:Peptidase n=2 Tax=Tepidimonas taiwanensis TaxID=307486 RepID=A0A554X555_9BURK|nr:DUF1415 domain-containing protein [Tepidimonas taiwanensis]TSE30957.1 hypothetical protein Ttaiw_01706 [Tepidimonas taiwanensis]